MRKQDIFVVAIMVLLLSGCSALTSRRIADDYRNALRLHEEYVLPNSLARPAEFDISAHLANVKEERRRLVGRLSTDEGIAFLRKHSGSSDDVERNFVEWALGHIAAESQKRSTNQGMNADQ
jgi:hypothetical protein